MKLKNLIERVTLLESNLGRLVQHIRGREYAILSANRSDEDPEVNFDNYRTMKDDLKALGYGWIPVQGVGQEEDEEKGGIKAVAEPSIFVINRLLDGGEASPDFKEQMIALGKKFHQWGISYGKPNLFQVLDIKQGRVDQEYVGPSALRVGINAYENAKYQTRLYKGKKTPRHTFAFEGYALARGYASLHEKRIRENHGEIVSNKFENTVDLTEYFYG